MGQYLQVTIQASQLYSPTPACNVEMTRCDPETLDPTASLEVDLYNNLITVFDTMEERERKMSTLRFYDQIILNRFDSFS